MSNVCKCSGLKCKGPPCGNSFVATPCGPPLEHQQSVDMALPLQAVVSYTQEQIKDLMHLRLLFYSKIGQLCRERKALLRHMADEQDVGANIGLDDVSVRLSEVSDLAEQLRANGADEYRTYMQFSSAFSRGVSFLPC
jgi:hypothetical protein